MAAYFTRSVRRPPGYYRALNACSSVDAEVETFCRPDKPKAGPTALSEMEVDQEDVYEVERLVQRRRSKVKSPTHPAEPPVTRW